MDSGPSRSNVKRIRESDPRDCPEDQLLVSGFGRAEGAKASDQWDERITSRVNYYPHHIGDYLRDTSHLTALEDGTYRRMLDVYYASEKPLPLETHWVCRLVRARSNEEMEAVSEILRQYFVKHADGWHNKRADQEIIINRRRIKAAKVNGKRGGRPKNPLGLQKKPTGLAETQKLHNPDESSQHQHQNQRITTPRPAFAVPDWVPREDWQAFEDSRKKLRKPMTDRARSLVLAELEKLRAAGHDPAVVLAQSIRKGWLDVFPLKDAPARQTGEVI